MKPDVLKKIYLFNEMTDAELSLIFSAGDEKNYIAGQELFFSGQAAQSFFVVVQGMVKIFKTNENADDHALATIAAGEHFGEMAYLTRDPRTATAQIVETSLVLEMSYSKLDKIFEQNPTVSAKFHKALARFLAQRLKSTTNELIVAKG